MISLLLLGLFTVTRTTYGLQNAAVFALLGDDVALPCSIPSVGSCSEVRWNVSGDFPGLYTEVVRAGVVTPEQPPTVRVGPGCSLHIRRLERSSARTYVCGDGRSSARLSLEILQMSSTEIDATKGTMEIHCFLDHFKGHVSSCRHQGIRLEWLSEANTTLNTERFAVESPTKCFSKLIFKPKLTDHRRTWRCQLKENDTVITSLGYTINITDGIQEVFAVVDEWVSFFSCGTSSIAGGRVEWVGPQSRGDVAGDSRPAFTFNKIDFSLAVSRGQSGDYQCSPHGDQTKVLAKVRLHTLDVSAAQEGSNLTLSCLLTCALDRCDQDVTLGWTRGSQYAWLSGGSHSTKNTIISKIFTADVQLTGAPVVCSVYKDGVLRASKTWSATNRAASPAAWLALPLGLLLCATVGGLYFHSKKNTEKGAGNEAGAMEMVPVYEVIPDLNQDKTVVQSNAKKSNSTSNDGFYDLLQAVE